MNVPTPISLKASGILNSGGAGLLGSTGASFSHSPGCASFGVSLGGISVDSRKFQVQW